MPRTATRVLAATLLILTTGCTRPAAPTATPSFGPPQTTAPLILPRITITLRPPTGRPAQRIRVEDASTTDERARGLMFRSQVAPRSGMVFRYPRNNRGGYWMKNTLVPLSIAFFDADGRVLRVLDMAPCRQDPCRSYDPQVSYRGALEVNQGFFDQIGLTRGWRIELPSDLEPAQ